MNKIMKASLSLVFSTAAAVAASAAVGEASLAKFDCNTTNGVIARDGVSLDKSNSADGAGSLKLEASKPTTFKLLEVDIANIDKARLVYRGKLRTKDVDGKVYLEMWCHVPSKGEFFSRGLDQALSGSNEWSSSEIPFFLQSGQKCDKVKLNLVIDGSGTAWIDQIELVKAPL